MKRATIPSKAILNVGHDPELLHTRGLLLQSAGYIVESASSVPDAIKLLPTHDFGLVILCHSIPATEKERLIRAIWNDGAPIPVLFVDPACAPSPDRFSRRFCGSEPDGLLYSVGEVLHAA